jgi:hypothetical protein
LLNECFYLQDQTLYITGLAKVERVEMVAMEKKSERAGGKRSDGHAKNMDGLSKG